MTVLVTGATGSVGRLVVDALLAAGATDVRALTTDPARAALPPTVEIAHGSVARPSTLPAALDGVDRMYLAPYPRTVHRVARLARDAGVRHIVDLAGPKDGHWGEVEIGVEAAGTGWTHLEAGEFMANADLWAPQIRAGDTVRDGYGAAANAPIAMEDIAAAAATVLLDPTGHDHRAYDLTGPAAITREEKVHQIGAALGRTLTFVDLPHDEFVAQLTPVMGDYAAWYADGIRLLAAHPQAPTPDLATLLDRPATTFAAWAAANTALFQA
ncbi:NAD(P)H-binding protein [Spirilliplanes yamanashiensis]|uniref:Nucleotide-diphosphate-sugar epimerase n=1 Tax=Spirilliplanes yamanashiensis TaxID=42233 RepID=A0A8J3Y4U8_9ACTN|nr:NAD(P)H-binding protein [Spirilliplanes yamanashiensis]MDP9819775.1 uncharacterized protein YbjT (DUF2867 family) [Spirilliplanes yamanashiensis]GIJ01405.1 nucleotide-diphosphate-sugar epimerase [Spirilliplanes yamanashiensis]